jgi:putative transposase
MQNEEGIRTQIYQATLLNKEFAFPLQAVVILKTDLATHAQAHVILFSTDLKLTYEKIIDYHISRFQIEFNFRDAKQYWGLDGFIMLRKCGHPCRQLILLHGELQFHPAAAFPGDRS